VSWQDRYYGSGATNYDRDRCHTLRWAKEQVAVSEMVFSGPVLDVPVGTGRYVSIYRDKGLQHVGVDVSPDMLAEAKRKYPDLEAIEGSVFDLPFKDKQFDTVVCTRLLDWLTPEEMFTAISEMRRVARVLVVSIRYGKEEWVTNQTHDLAKFYDAIDGLYIWDQRRTERSNQGIEEIFRLQPPTWEDVLEQFKYHGHTPAYEIERLARAWFGECGLYREDWSQPLHASISAEYRHAAELAELVDKMGEEHDWDLPDEYRYVTSDPPRFAGGPATLLQKGDRTVVLDGRRRIGQWRKTEGTYPCLVLRI
jgi:hypothetical protein